jgi:hypothetical protein
MYMRDLINLIESLSVVTTESSRGLLYRAKNDRFFKGDKKEPTEALLFDKAEYFPGQPPASTGAYETGEEMLQAYQELEQQLGNITPVNQSDKSSRAFALLTLKDETTGQPVYYARFYRSIRPDMTGTWKNSDLDGFQLDTKTSLKGSYKLKPSDIFPGDARFPDVDALWSALQRSEPAQPYIPGLSMLFGANPEFPVFENAADKATAIRDDLGEIIGPIVMVQGLDAGTGAEAANRDLNGGRGWGGSSINFPSEKNYGLVDSYFVTPGGVEVGISSKGEKGAPASIKNIADGIKFIRTKGSDDQKKLLDTYSKQVDIIDSIGSASVIGYPLSYGVENQIIAPETAIYIKELIKSGAKKLEGFPPSSGSQTAMQEVQKLINAKGAKTGLLNYNVGYHALVSLAMQVAAKINSDPKFGEACLKFVNSAPIIQLHMYIKTPEDNSVAVTKFVSKYPPNFEGTVKLDPSKTYSSTGATGRMSFAYSGKDAGLGDPEEVGPSEKEFTSKAADIALGRNKLKIDKPVPTGNVGRAKR